MQTASKLTLPSRFFQAIQGHEGIRRFWLSPARFNLNHSGRRSYKTELVKRKIVKIACAPWSNRLPAALRAKVASPRYFLAGPTYLQTKKIFWNDLKAMIPDGAFQVSRARSISEGELTVRLKYSEIFLVGMDVPERIEGSMVSGGGIDEYGNMKKDVWPMHIRPMLADTNGWADLIGVPEGRNHYYDTSEKFREAEYTAKALGGLSEYMVHHWHSETVLPTSEIDAAKLDMDELTYQQEFGGSFVYFHGRAYYSFLEYTHCDALAYDPRAPLILCFDFNRAPGVAAVCQEQKLPSGQDGTGVIGEVWIPQNSNTPAVCRRLIQDWGKHQGLIYCYGDATGGSGGSAKVQGSDWDLVRDELRPAFGDRLYFRVAKGNPRERVRINAVNSRLLSQSGAIRLMVDPGKAPHVVKDFEGVRLLEGGSGEIDKRSDPELSHLTDAIGGYIVEKFPTTQQSATSQEFFV